MFPPGSEVTQSITFGNGGMTAGQIDDFRIFLHETYGEEHVTLEEIDDQSLVYCLGNNMATPGVAGRAALALGLAEINIGIQNQPYRANSMVYSVQRDQVEAATQALHRACIELKDTELSELPAALAKAK